MKDYNISEKQATNDVNDVVGNGLRQSDGKKMNNMWINQAKDPLPIRSSQATDNLFLGFTLLGVNMPERHKYFYLGYSVLINFLVTLILPLTFILSYLQLSGAELEIGNLLTSVQVAINVVTCSIKIIIMSFLLKTLRSTIPVLDKLDARCQTQQEFRHLSHIVQKGRRFVLFFAMAYWSYATSTFLGSVLMGRPPYALYNPFFDWHQSLAHFWAQSLVEFLLMFGACSQQVVDDSYAVIYVCILRTHIQIFMERLERLGSNAAITEDKNVEELKECIQDHKNILEFYNIISPVISTTIFLQFTITAIILGTTLINIFIFASDFSSVVASCFYILAVVVEIFPLCYQSQCLMDDSDRMTQVIFHSNWMGQSRDYRKMLIFLMHRSQKRLALTAGKLFPITLNSFLSIAKFSFSLYTFIKAMGIKGKFD